MTYTETGGLKLKSRKTHNLAVIHVVINFGACKWSILKNLGVLFTLCSTNNKTFSNLQSIDRVTLSIGCWHSPLPKLWLIKSYLLPNFTLSRNARFINCFLLWKPFQRHSKFENEFFVYKILRYLRRCKVRAGARMASHRDSAEQFWRE